MRRTNDENRTTAIRNTDHPQTLKRAHRILITMVLLFVVAGVSGIAGFMCVLIPQQYSKQAGEQFAILRTATVGDCICLGKYEQDNDLSDGAEPIEWLILAKENNRFLLVSKYALDNVPFNKDSQNGTWSRSSIQRWLNEKFFLSAFSAVEQSMIRLTDSSSEMTTSCDADSHKSTNSRVFLLSLDEVQRYFRNSDERQCKPTAYAASKGAGAENSGCGWWLRSHGYFDSAATRVLADGRLNFIGQPAERDSAVRPAIWIEYNEPESV